MEPNQELNSEATNDLPMPPTLWNEAIAASAEAQKETVPTYEDVEEVLDLPLRVSDLAVIAQENAVDDQLRNEAQRDLDELKLAMKDKKAEVSSIEARIRERHSNVRAGAHKVKKTWRVYEMFAANTVRYIDPTTNEVVLERAMTAGERQTELALDVVDKAIANGATTAEVEAAPNDDASVTDPEALLEAAQRGAESDDEEEDFDDFADDDDGDDSEDES